MTKKTIKHFRLKGCQNEQWFKWTELTQKFYWTELNATEQNKKLNLT